MASITQSIIVEDSPQADSRRYVRERHTDNIGVVHEVLYLAEQGADASLMLPIRAAQIVTQLEEAENAANEAEALGDA